MSRLVLIVQSENAFSCFTASVAVSRVRLTISKMMYKTAEFELRSPDNRTADEIQVCNDRSGNNLEIII